MAAGVLAAGTVAVVVQRAADEIARALPESFPASALLDGTLLKPSLSLRALLAAGAEVENALRIGDLAQARRSLAWHLVSRDVSELSASEVAGAAIASLAENVSDALVAPLLAYGLGGLPAAYAYRFVNTADAMLGYRTPELEWFGKSAARFDDLLNLVPARLAALLIGTAAPVGGGSTHCAFRCALRDHARTPSPNAGWPMAAMAGALGVCLTKREVYVLNPRGRAPGWRDIARTRRVILATAVGAVALSEAGIALSEW